MIARVWRGWTNAQDANAYEQLLCDVVYPGLEGIPGYHSGYILRQDSMDETEFVRVNLFESMDAVKAFAGSEYELPVFEPAARRLLSTSEDRLPHPQYPADHIASPWGLPARQAWFFVLALSTGALVVFLRLIQLDELQAEMYNDIVILYNYLAEIRRGAWPLRFVLSTGPLYHYLIMPIVALTGMNYFGLKLASVIVSLGVLAATYGLSRRLINDHFALLAVFIAGVSSWLLIFSRLGNSQILVPLLTTCALWLLARMIQRARRLDLVACAIVSALGLYVYPQSWVLPAVIVVTLVCLRWSGHSVRWADVGRFVLLLIPLSLPFVWLVSQDPKNVVSGYIGDKLTNYHGDFVGVVLGNFTRALLALHVRGDSIFRSNPPGLPHLDQISGLLFLVGIVFWLERGRRQWSSVLLVPLVLLQLPSMLVLAVPEEVPSASRSLGVAPLVYILVASGLWWLVQTIWALQRLAAKLRPSKARHGGPLTINAGAIISHIATGGRWVGPAIAGLLLGAILLLNTHRYFQIYTSGLPYHNTPVGQIIATYVDLLPADTQIYLIGCCWVSSMPQTESVQYAMARPQNLHLVEPSRLSCDQLRSLPLPVVLVWSFHMTVPAPQLEACKQWLPAQLYSSRQGLPVFFAAPLQRDRAIEVPGEQSQQ